MFNPPRYDEGTGFQSLSKTDLNETVIQELKKNVTQFRGIQTETTKVDILKVQEPENSLPTEEKLKQIARDFQDSKDFAVKSIGSMEDVIVEKPDDLEDKQFEDISDNFHNIFDL